jgi:hypothetical protein
MRHMTTSLITNEEFWHDSDLITRLRLKTQSTRDWGIQYHLQFVNGYGLSIINGAGLGVEVMVLDAEDGTIAKDDVPVEALVWIREMLADDTVIAHLNPTELRDIIFDVAYWPDRNVLEGDTDGDRDHE